MLTTRQFQCWRPGMEKPRPVDCGPTCATIGRRRRDSTGGVVRLHTGSQGRTPAGTPEQVPGHAAGRCLRRVRADLRKWSDSGSCLLGACAPEFYDIQVAHKSLVAAEALERIGRSMRLRATSTGDLQRNVARSATHGADLCSDR